MIALKINKKGNIIQKSSLIIDEELDITLIQEILHYALYAPSAHNEQAWKYYIISK